MSLLSRTIFYPLVSGLLLVAASGCILVGAASALMPPPTVEAQYTRFAGQSIAVMVWADRGIRIDWPTLQVDLANSLQNKLKLFTAKKQPLEGAVFPFSPQSMGRYQEDHPQAEFAPIESTAAKLPGVTRLIYIEVEDLRTRTDVAGELFLGRMTATVKVVEVDGGKGVVAYEERDINVAFPPKSPPEGTPRGSDASMYLGVIDTMASRIQDRFVPYQQE